MSFDYRTMAAAAVALACMAPLTAAGQQSAAADAQTAAAHVEQSSASVTTPHLPNGQPDLNGTWDVSSGHTRSSSDHPAAKKEEDGSIIVLYNRGPAYTAPPRQSPVLTGAALAHLPPYKPSLLDKVHDLDVHQIKVDPNFACRPPGVPRIGPPHKIIQNAREVVFIYSDLNGNFWRIIPTDGRGHDIDADPSYLGDSIGHFEGDTLVVDDTNFNDETWLGNNGLFHSTALHVTERLTRNGDKLLYDVTVEDPNVLTQPWKMPPKTLTASDAPLEEAPPCVDVDQSHFVNLDHH